MSVDSEHECDDCFKPLTLEDLLAREIEEREPILHPWLPARGLAMLYGPRGIGKTHVGLGAAFAIAAGGEFLRWRAPKPRKVLVIDGEMPASALQARLRAIWDSTERQPPPGHLRVLAMDLQNRDLDIGRVSDHGALADAVDDAEVIFLDNISTLLAHAQENDADSWSIVQRWALKMRREGRSVVFVHHAGKGGAQRGTSKREHALDSVIALKKPADYEPRDGARFQISFEKSRGFFGDDAESFEAALGPDGWTTRSSTDGAQSQILGLAESGIPGREIADEMGMSASQVQRFLAAARADGALKVFPSRGGGRRTRFKPEIN